MRVDLHQARARRVRALDLAAVAGELAGDVAHAVLGRDDLHVHDRLEHDRPRLGERVEERLASGGDERDLLRVDRVVLAVVDGDAHVLQRIAGEEAVVEHPAHALLDRRDELVGDRAALHAVDELEALAARQRLDLEEHLAELAGAAGLLLVAAVALGARGDGLAIRRSTAAACRARACTASTSSPGWCAGAARPGRASRSRWPASCARCGSTESSARILCSTSETFCSSPRFFGWTARPNIGVGSSSGRAWMCSSSAESCSTWSNWISSILATAQMSPGTASCTSTCCLAAQHVEVPGLDRLPALADEELAAGREAPLVHAEHREPADVRVDLDLEHVREHVLAGIGDRREIGALAVAGLGDDVGRAGCLRWDWAAASRSRRAARRCRRRSSPR